MTHQHMKGFLVPRM